MADRRVTDYCLVSAQPLPNLLPCLDAGFRPSRVVLVVAPGQRTDPVPPLRNAMPPSIAVEVLPILDAYDFAGTIERIHRHASARRAAGDVTRLNLTGGTKVMAMAAYRALEGGRLGPMYYLNIQTGRLDWIDASNARPSTPLQADLNLQTFFDVHGYGLVYDHGTPSQAKHAAFARNVGARCVELQEALVEVNRVFDEVQRSPMVEMRFRVGSSQQRRAIDPLMALAADHGLISRSAGHFVFLGDASLATATLVSLRGGWLESYVHDVVRSSLGRGVQDVTAGVRIRGASDAMNEVDVAYLMRNELTLVECKTTKTETKFRSADAKGEGASANVAPFNAATDKLAALRKSLGALKVELVLVSLQRLGPAILRRAAARNIKVVHGAHEIQGFEATLAAWMQEKERSA
jgi:hypothetical protein